MQCTRLAWSCAIAAVLTVGIVQEWHGGAVHDASTPRSLPSHFAFGLQADKNPNGLDGWMPNSGIPWDYAVQYLAGGVNTSSGWQNGWGPNGSFPRDYAHDADARGYIPVFDYYTLNGSIGTCSRCSGAHLALANLNNPGLMAGYYANFRLLMERLSAQTYDGITGFGKTAIVHVEPDLSGFAEQAVLNPAGQCYGYCTAQGNSPAYLTAAVGSSGDADVAAYPNTYQGFNWALLHLRDHYAPNVLLAFNVSNWATNIDIGSDTRTTTDATALGREAGSFAAQSGIAGTPAGVSTYDMVFNDPADHDAGWQQIVNHNPHDWWDRLNATVPNFHRWEAYLKAIGDVIKRPLLAWQVPMGNQYFDTENNTDGHYQDNRAEYIFGHIAELAQSGLIGVLFGQGGVNTKYYDGDHDGVTNPRAFCTSSGVSSGQICNDHPSSFADDDGGYLRTMARRYYAGGEYPLSGTPPQTIATETTVPPTGAATPAATPSATLVAPPARVVVAAPVQLSTTTVSRGQMLTASVTLQNAGNSSITLLAVVIAGRPPGGTKVGGPYDDFGGTGTLVLNPGEHLTVRETRRFTASDPAGIWYAFVTYQTLDGTWHDDPATIRFAVR